MNTLSVQVTDIRQITPVIREFSLSPTEAQLRSFSSGSHIILQLPTQERLIKNAYSLISDPFDRHQYQIAVRLQEHSRGGSKYMHEHVAVGDVLNVTAISNLFALNSRARHHVFIAGGIGITPFISHMKALLHSSGSFELHYACRDGISNAYEDVLSVLFSDQVQLYSEKTKRRLEIKNLLSAQDTNSHVYVCGPERLIQEVTEIAQSLGWSKNRVHLEAFAAPKPGVAFDVELSQSQKRIHVPEHLSILEALEAEGVDVPNLCRGGVCGQCMTKHHSIEVDHQDHFLDQDEQQQYLMPCVSRAKKVGQCLNLEL